MSTRVAFVAVCLALLAGCNDKSDELQKQLSQAQNEQASARQLLGERDKYIEEVMTSVNDIYKDLEQSRVKEGRLLKQSKGAEWNAQAENVDTKQKLLADLSDIGSTLKENRKRIGDLQARMRKFNLRIASLDSLVSNLKSSLQEREASIAMLETKVQGLEASVAEKTKVIQDREIMIDDQQRKINTAFYVIGTRDELKKKGIIADEGGFLWGLLGSTTVMAGDVDPAAFTPIDKTKDQTIHVQGKIEEILPRRTDSAFSMAEAKDQNVSDLTIVSPDKFWRNNYLVIVTD
jgi:hypothetical protein